VEFYAPYYEWTLDYAKEVRKELDGLGVHCYSTHIPGNRFTPDGLNKTIELNQASGHTLYRDVASRRGERYRRLEASLRIL